MKNNSIFFEKITIDFVREMELESHHIDERIGENLETIRNMSSNVYGAVDMNWFEYRSRLIIRENNFLYEKQEKIRAETKKWMDFINKKKYTFIDLSHLKEIITEKNKRKKILNSLLEKYSKNEEFEKCIIIRDLIKI